MTTEHEDEDEGTDEEVDQEADEAAEAGVETAEHEPDDDEPDDDEPDGDDDEPGDGGGDDSGADRSAAATVAPAPQPARKAYVRPRWPPSAYRQLELPELGTELTEIEEELRQRSSGLAPGERPIVDDLVEWRRLVIDAAQAHDATLRAELRVQAGDFVDLGDRRWLVRSTPTDRMRIVYLDYSEGGGSWSRPVDATGLVPYTGPLTVAELGRRAAVVSEEPERVSSFGPDGAAIVERAAALVGLDGHPEAVHAAPGLRALELNREELGRLDAAALSAAQEARGRLEELRRAAWLEYKNTEAWLDARDDARMFGASCCSGETSMDEAAAARKRTWPVAAAAVLAFRELALAAARAREQSAGGSSVRLHARVRRAEVRVARARQQLGDLHSDRATPLLFCGPSLVRLGSRRERSQLAAIARLGR